MTADTTGREAHPRLIHYEVFVGLWRLTVPGYRARHFVKRGDAMRLLGRYVRRYGAWWLERSVL